MDTVAQVGANFEQLIMILEENQELKKHLEIRKSRLGDDPTLYIYNKDLKRLIFFKGRGAGQKMRGTRIMGKDLILSCWMISRTMRMLKVKNPERSLRTGSSTQLSLRLTRTSMR